MFTVGAADKAIPTIREVPLTREEIAARRRRRTILAGFAVLCALVALFLGWRFIQHREVIAACQAAESTGRIAAIDAALAMLDTSESPADLALRARLLATAVLAGETDRRETAEALLARHDPSADGASDHRIAAAYLALAAGDPAAAARDAASLVAGRGPRAAEAAHARARAALAIGNLEAAEAAAEAARSDMAGSPRHEALLLDITARRGTAPSAAGPNDATVLRSARSRGALETGGTELAATEAQAVLDASDATPAEHAWAELVLAALAADRGDTVAALASLERATERPPPGDESFVIVVSETYVAVGRGADADRVIEGLIEDVSTDAGRRAILNGRRALLRGDTEAATRAIATAPASAERSLVEAEIAALGGHIDVARTGFQALLGDPHLGLRARILLARALGRSALYDEAWTTIEPALTSHATDPRVVAAAASILAGRGERDRARTLLTTRIETLPREPLLLLELARIHATAAEWDAALVALETAAETNPGDPIVQLERGLAARAVASFDVAAVALSASLAARPGHPLALIALFETHIDRHDMESAARISADLEAAGIVSPDVDRLRARFLVDSLAGATGVAAMEAAVGRSPADGTLRIALARLEYQAERWEDAADSFYAAASRLPEQRQFALAMRALALARARRRPTVEAVLEQIRRDTPIPVDVMAVMSVAEGWLERHDEVFGRAGIFARLALDRDPTNDDATFLLGVLDEIQHRDATTRLHAVEDVSLEAVGLLALLATSGDAEGCVRARRYLAGAPTGRLVADLRTWSAGCPVP